MRAILYAVPVLATAPGALAQWPNFWPFTPNGGDSEPFSSPSWGQWGEGPQGPPEWSNWGNWEQWTSSSAATSSSSTAISSSTTSSSGFTSSATSFSSTISSSSTLSSSTSILTKSTSSSSPVSVTTSTPLVTTSLSSSTSQSTSKSTTESPVSSSTAKSASTSSIVVSTGKTPTSTIVSTSPASTGVSKSSSSSTVSKSQISTDVSTSTTSTRVITSSTPSTASTSSTSTSVSKSQVSTGVSKSSTPTGISRSSTPTGISQSSTSTGVSNSSTSTGVSKSSTSTGVSKSSTSTGVSKSSISTGVSKSSISTGVSSSSTSTSVSKSPVSTGVSKSSTSPGISTSSTSNSISRSPISTGVSKSSTLIGVSSASISTSVSKSSKSTSASRSPVSSGVSRSSVTSASGTAISKTSSAPATTSTANQCSYWLEDIKHQGIAAFNPSPSTYKVFRNVKDFGAKGDGVTDDTAAINAAISSGGRCGPLNCNSTTVTPAVVYFPPGVYAISSNIVDYYYTQLIGNPNCLPTILGLANFTSIPGGVALVDGDLYGANGLDFGATNIFWRQVRNFIIDTTRIPASQGVFGVHWPTGQATSLQNLIFNLNNQAGTQHTGVLIENGSGGFLADLVFNGGRVGMQLGNQQFTMRNLTFNDQIVAITMNYDWGWTYSNLNINNASVGINMTSGEQDNGILNVGSITLYDSVISDTLVGIQTGWSTSSQPPAGNSVILENVQINNVPSIVQGAGNVTVLSGVDDVTAWGQGHAYVPTGPNVFQGTIAPNARPAGLIAADGKYYQRSKPQYGDVPVSGFLSARSAGATGNGRTDDTAALQSAINTATSQGKILFLDQGDYLVTSTILVPAGAKIVGESYSVILSSGSFFNDINSPQPVVQIGEVGDVGIIEWSDCIVSTQGQQQGAILIQYNLASPSGTPSGIWDVHSRVGGFTGSDLQVAQCIKTPDVVITSANLQTDCIAAYLGLHITTAGTGLYLENNWFWTADHDVDDADQTQITIYAGRGLLDESIPGIVWLVGTAVEHHTLYQYQFVNTRNVFAGQVQTETPYYQPNPSAPSPWPYNAALSDPVFPSGAAASVNGTAIPNADAWGLRVVNSQSMLFYGVGLYSFFDNYNTSCSAAGNGERCQTRIVDIETSEDVSLYNLNTVGVHYQITLDGVDVAYYDDNLDGFPDTVAMFRTIAQ